MDKEQFLKSLGTPSDDYRLLRKVEASKETDPWETLETEGQLAVDVFETPTEIVIVSTVAGARPEDLDIHATSDTITIRGKRHDDSSEDERNYYYRECYFGAFSRTVVLPTHVAADRADATLKNGILTLKLPKVSTENKIRVKEES
jgi:HSP20 family protein